jgi:hypothetical protein
VSGNVAVLMSRFRPGLSVLWLREWMYRRMRSTTCARRHVTTDPDVRRTIGKSRLPFSLVMHQAVVDHRHSGLLDTLGARPLGSC